jgi:hypothetical protein
MPRRIGGPRRRAGNQVWEELANDELVLYFCETEIYSHTPFANREELLESYPSWRGVYLEFKREQHACREPQPPNSPDPMAQEHLEANYQMLHKIWVSDAYRVPALERLYQENL